MLNPFKEQNPLEVKKNYFSGDALYENLDKNKKEKLNRGVDEINNVFNNLNNRL